VKHKLLLVSLRQQQIKNSKQINGSRKRITHALICGTHGQLFGTEKFCRKYYRAWLDVFPLLFEEGVETDNCEIADYQSTPELVTKLIELHDTLEKDAYLV